MVFVSSVGVLYIWSAEQIKKGAPNGIEAALGKFLLVCHCHGWFVHI